MRERIIYVYDNATEINRVNFDICSEIGRIESMNAVPIEIVIKRFEELKPKGYILKLDCSYTGIKAKLPQDIRSKLIGLTKN